MRVQAKVERSPTLETSIWENLRMTNIMDLEFIRGKTVTDMKGIG